MDEQVGGDPKESFLATNGLVEQWKDMEIKVGEEEDEMIILLQSFNALTAMFIATCVCLLRLKRKRWEECNNEDFRSMPRSARRFCDHKRASKCILKDYLGPTSLFDGDEFQIMFRISRPLFEHIATQLVDYKPHWKQMADAYGVKGPCTAAKILLPLCCIGYGVPPHTFCNYFQMSPTAAKLCFNRFITDVTAVFSDQF